ncbi:MAG: response regulator, partial [Planctomycetota bacterium]
HSVTVAGSAERAMLHVERESDYDVIVVHLILPSIDGAELCRWLQRWSPLPGVPRVVFSSAGVHLRLGLEESLPRWLPADVYMHALEDVEELVHRVESLLAGT